MRYKVQPILLLDLLNAKANLCGWSISVYGEMAKNMLMLAKRERAVNVALHMNQRLVGAEEEF